MPKNEEDKYFNRNWSFSSVIFNTDNEAVIFQQDLASWDVVKYTKLVSI